MKYLLALLLLISLNASYALEITSASIGVQGNGYAIGASYNRYPGGCYPGGNVYRNGGCYPGGVVYQNGGCYQQPACGYALPIIQQQVIYVPQPSVQVVYVQPASVYQPAVIYVQQSTFAPPLVYYNGIRQ